MKRIVRCMVLVLLMVFVVPLSAAQAATKIDLAIDGVVVPEKTADNSTSFYLEARPQMRSNSVFVPVRVVSEILGTDVTWQNPNIGIKYGDLEIKLTVGSRTAYRGEQKITLPAAPYVQGGYTYVPIRFVAEAFDCDVEWQAKKNLVNIKAKPWELNGHDVVGVVWQENMTGYSMTYELNSPYFAQRFYQIILAGLGDEVAAPSDFGDLRAEQFGDDAYNTTHYCLDKTILFMVDEDNYVLAMKYYTLDRGQAEHSRLISINDKWYTLKPGLINDLNALFYITETDRLYDYKEYQALN